MIVTNEIASITVLVSHRWPTDSTTEEIVPFKVYKEGQQFKAVPLLSKEGRRLTGLPEVVLFSFLDHCIVTAKNMEEETLNVVKKIIQELSLQGL